MTTVTRQGGTARLKPPTDRTTGTAIAMMCGLAAVEISHTLLTGRGSTHSAVAIGIIVLLSSVQVCYFRASGAPSRFPIAHLALAAQATLTFLPAFLLHQAWVAVPGLLAGNVLLVLPQGAGRVAYVVVVTATGATHAAVGAGATATVFGLLTTAMTGLVAYGLPRLAVLATRLDESRTELAHCAVADERMRVSRDLHDLLGYGLSAIKLKSELAHRMLPEHPVEARQSVAEILDIARHTMADVRSIALGYRLLSVRETITSATAVLTSADVAVHAELDDQQVPEPAATVLATLVREGVTNVLRHSKAEHCDITVRRHGDLVLLDIVNDGVVEPTCDRSSSGVRNMTERVHEIGGAFTAGRAADGRFHLHASIPLDVRDAPEELAG